MSSEWSKWERIVAYIPAGKALYRATGPNVLNYIQMTLTSTAIDYLASLGIDGVFCIGTWPFLYPQPQQLEARGIEYKYMSVPKRINGEAPTQDTFDGLWDFFSNHKAILIYDGEGKGRSGSGVTAIQLFLTHGRNPPLFNWKKTNGVETPSQIEALKALQKRLGYSKHGSKPWEHEHGRGHEPGNGKGHEHNHGKGWHGVISD